MISADRVRVMWQRWRDDADFADVQIQATAGSLRRRGEQDWQAQVGGHLSQESLIARLRDPGVSRNG